MAEIRSKKQLAVALGAVEGFKSAKVSVEQYNTDSEIAADVLWNCHILGDLGKVRIGEGKIADLGAGTGILGIGALLLGADSVDFLESEKSALEGLRANLGTMKLLGRSKVLDGDLSSIKGSYGMVIMNPPFGTKNKHADKAFLEKAFSLGSVVWSFHKTSTRGFVEAICRDSGFSITHTWDYKFPIPRSMEFHSKRRVDISVTVFRMEKGL
ncbi:MAG: METTL5 family protein [Candidatus Woesearchaeota archaeon]|jgi:putative methylase|nr:METTL5 family protein [Candidatus Woesearchaeota archaeon]MDP7323276.1 METTL5 family protein [Candidatus Woesearchaeota archaeon]MDP7458245.1 METTL5 family protein [Candidatus Woesearchaeota archaeon]